MPVSCAQAVTSGIFTEVSIIAADSANAINHFILLISRSFYSHNFFDNILEKLYRRWNQAPPLSLPKIEKIHRSADICQISCGSLDFIITIQLFPQRVRPVVDILLEVDDLMVVWLIHQLGLDHEIRCGFVVRHRYVVHLSDTEQSLHIRIVWCCRERIREENHEIYPSLNNLRTDLLVSSKRTAVVALHLKICPVCYHTGCGSRSAQLMPAQYVPVVLAPSDELFLLRIMGDKSYSLLLWYGHCDVICTHV